MKTYPFCLIFFLLSLQSNAQQDCSNPVVVSICPSVCLTNQTNAGPMGDDAPSSCNLVGNDVTYRVNVVGGAVRLIISVTNASAPLRLIVEHDTCLNTGCASTNIGSGNSNSTFTMTTTSYYNVWVDDSKH